MPHYIVLCSLVARLHTELCIPVQMEKSLELVYDIETRCKIYVPASTDFSFTCVSQTYWRRESSTSMNFSPSACTATCAAACLRSTNSCLPSSCALASWWMRTKLIWWATGEFAVSPPPLYILWICVVSLWQAEWRYMLSGGMPVQELPNPAVSWLSERAWLDILALSALDNFRNLAESFTKHLQGFKRIFDSNRPHRHA